ncbi:MAG: hypothetical protein N3F07_03210 [Candidatus Micrarchaeota archaeon]|nr:hypothetical protein [Candidatus Micrarchaeota archaeon]
MFLFQLQQAARKEEDEDSRSESHVGMKIKRRGKGMPEDFMVLSEDSLASLTLKNLLKDKEIDSFVSTLTPGAQNAIHAASFVWGYENALKSLKNAMKIDEVKNATDPIERSKAVIESMQSQLGQLEKKSEVSKFVWSYYNEDLKEAQAHSAKTESITDKTLLAMQQPYLALNAQEAVCASLAMGTYAPALLYCAGSIDAAQQAAEARLKIEKRERMASLIKQENVVPIGKEPVSEEQKAKEAAEEASKIAMQRKEEIVKEWEKLEKDLQIAIKVLDKLSEQERDKVRKIAGMLPRELANFLTINQRAYPRKIALRLQLSSWLAFAQKSRSAFSSLTPSRLFKLASLSSIFKRMG